MLKLKKYLKPFIGLIISAIVLLFIQAMCDLKLPDYMSDIVNKGIQQGGIVTGIPEAVRKSQMEKYLMFMGDDDKKSVEGSYTLVDSSSESYEKYLKKYPKLKDEPIYVLNSISKDEKADMENMMAKAILAVSGIEKAQKEAKDGVIDMAGQKIPAGTDIFAMIGHMPKEQLQNMMDQMSEKFEALGGNMLSQAAAGGIKEEYAALGMDTGKIQTRYILNTGLMMLLVALLIGICTVSVGFIASRTGAGVARNLRKDVFTKVEQFSNAEFDKFSTASLITRTTNDITQIQNVTTMVIRMALYAPIIGIGGVIRALQKSASMSWIIAVAVIVLLGVIFTMFTVAMPKFKIIQKLIDRLNRVTRENLSGMMVIRAFNTQKFEEKRFDNANNDLTRTDLFINRAMATMMPVMMLIMNGVTLLIVWVGAHRIAESSMQVGDMMAFMQYAMQIIMAFLMISMMFIFIPRASVSAGRISEILDTDIAIKDASNEEEFKPSCKGVVEFKNVSFKYPHAEEDVLKNITFKAMPGETTAFIGSTGSGKTTLVNLIPRFYDVTSGEILVDGVDIRKVSQKKLRDRIGYIPQKAFLFSGTIESNLKYGDKNADDEYVMKSAETAQAMEIINEKPEGIKAEIAQEATNVSGGQKQRLSIARALVKKPEIFIFDDSFSALDFKTDAALRHALKKDLKDSTLLIVAQRISTIKNAERIIVLDNGEMVGMGTHKELMENCPTYKEIALSQLSKEELA